MNDLPAPRAAWCPPLLSLVLVACSGGTSDTDATDAPTTDTGPFTEPPTTGDTGTIPQTPCTIEAALAVEQQALGLTPPSVCADLVDLGDLTLIEAGVVPVGTDFGAVLSSEALAHREELEGTRHLFRYDDLTLSVPTDSAADLELAVLAAQAMSSLRTRAPSAAAIFDEIADYPSEPTLGCCAWRNRYDHIVLSLDATPRDIGASVSVLGEGTPSGPVDLYGNTALVSIDRETVLGGDPALGSRPIYGRNDDRDNLLLYFDDGALFTLAHEATHLYIDHRNSVSQVANWVWNGRTYINDAYVAAEEVVADYSACEPLQSILTTDMLDANVAITANLRSLYGVDDRLDELRAMSNAGSERLILDAGPGCGG